MKHFYKGGRGLAFSEREGGTSFRKEKPPRLSEISTNQVEGKSSGAPSAIAWQVIGCSLRYHRDLVEHCSNGIRQLFGCCSSVVGVAPEAHPNQSRSGVEACPKVLRTAPEETDIFSNRGRDSSLICFFSIYLCFLDKYRCSRRIFSWITMKDKSMPSVWALICFMLFNLSTAWAQSAESRTAEGQTEIKPLQVGDTIPEEVWNMPLQIVNHLKGKDTITLNDYRDKKLIVLDFWATWCGNCIKNFPKLYAFQQENDNIIILPINAVSTRDTPKKVAEFLTGRKEAYQFPSVVNDTAVSGWFPHQTLPHYVFLSGDKVVAIVEGDQAGFVNWDKVFHGDYRIQQRKVQKEYDFTKPLFKEGNGGDRPEYIFSSFLSGYVEGIPGQIYKGGQVTRRVSFINVPLISILKFAIPSLREFTDTRMRYRVADPFLFSRRVEGETRNLFIYEMEMPPTALEKAEEFVRQDMERYLHLDFTIVKEEVACLVLEAVDPKLALDFPDTLPRGTNLYEESGARVFYDNYPLKKLLNYLEEKYTIPFIDETGFTTNVRLELAAEIGDMDKLKQSFKRFGLRLKEETRDINIMVISENNLTKQ